jgi:hypothetical protein
MKAVKMAVKAASNPLLREEILDQSDPVIEDRGALFRE